MATGLTDEFEERYNRLRLMADMTKDMKCFKCLKEFIDARTFQIHLEDHMEEGSAELGRFDSFISMALEDCAQPLRCVECNTEEVFGKKIDLDLHKLLFHPKSLVCKFYLCSYCCDCKWEMDVHEHNDHLLSTACPFGCAIGNPSPEDMDKHVFKEHLLVRITCRGCQRRYSSDKVGEHEQSCHHFKVMYPNLLTGELPRRPM